MASVEVIKCSADDKPDLYKALREKNLPFGMAFLKRVKKWPDLAAGNAGELWEKIILVKTRARQC